MKKYLLFAGEIYYPMGGVNDFIDSFESLEDAKHAGEREIEDNENDWFHIADKDDLEIVYKFKRG